MRRLSDWDKVRKRMAGLDERHRTPLNLRLLGYQPDEVRHLWGALRGTPEDAKDLLGHEERSLRLDLIFPSLYAVALGVSLLLAWGWRNRGFSQGWLLLPVVIYLLADWTENLIQLGQLRLYRQAGPNALQDGRIRIASMATTVKLLFFCSSFLLIVVLLLTA